MVRARSSVAVVALLTVALLASVPSAFAEDTLGPIGKSTKKVAKPTKSPATRTRERMALKGVVDGEHWGVSIQLTDMSQGNALRYLCAIARARPREITMNIDHLAIKDARVDLERTLTLDVKNISLE